MNKIVLVQAVAGLICLVGSCYSQPSPTSSPADQVAKPADEVTKAPDEAAKPPDTPLESVLTALQKKADELTSYQCKIDYLVTQPLLESKTRRTGVLFYARLDDRSYLRIDFDTLQQDEEPQQQYREQFIFDGVWLQHISYATQSVERRQIAEPNRPVDAFSLASQHVPVFGFAKVGDLRQQFDIELVLDEQAGPLATQHLHLTAKPDSTYKEDYKTIDFWIDKTAGLPAQVKAVGTEADVGDIYEIRLIEPKVNAGIDKSVFQVRAPASFSVETIPLEKPQKPK
jgi:outer membrane lipoprotein-sorting protein